ncbi:MAG: ABC transporter substrate-binding protein, partial [Actinomycetes bacterium]
MQNKTRNSLIVSLSLLLAVSLTAIPAQAATTSSKTSAKSAMASAVKNPVVLRMTRLGDISQAFGPTRNSSGSDHLLNALIFSNLVKVAPDEKTILPDLATSWVASADASEFTFTLAQGVKWSDGKPFTAADVISTISMACHFGP